MPQTTLSPAAQQHINDNHEFETIGRMAVVLSAPDYIIRAYCLQTGLTPTQRCTKRKVDQAGVELFDIDKYAIENVTI